MNARQFAQQAAGHQYHEGPEQHVNAQRMSTRFLLAQGRGQQQAAGYIGGGNPENGQLKMPGSQNVARQVLGQVDAVETSGIGPIVGQGATDHNLR